MDLSDETQPEAPVSSSGAADARADDVALELMKQLITLASGVLALSATFIDKLRGATPWLLVILALSWLTLIASVFCGLETISAIVKSRLEPEENDWSTGRGKTYARVSKYTFVAGIALFAMVALLSILFAPTDESEESPRVFIQTN